MDFQFIVSNLGFLFLFVIAGTSLCAVRRIYWEKLAPDSNAFSVSLFD